MAKLPAGLLESDRLSGPTTLVPPPRWLSPALFLIAAVVYLATLTSDYYWDGITFSLQIEKVARAQARVALLFHQNHLLYNALGYLLYRATNALGFGVRALFLLQTANAFIGAGAVVVFFRMAARATRNVYVALVCTTFLAFSAAWWKISTDTNAYILTILLILLVANNLLGEKPQWLVAGLTFAGAMLIHELASLFYPAALVAVFLSKTIERKLRFATLMSVAAGVVTLAGYYACAYLVQGITSPIDLLKWAASNPSLKPVSSSLLQGMLTFPRTNLDAILGHNFGLFRSQSNSIELSIALAAGLAGLGFALVVARRVDIVRAFRTLLQWAPETADTRKQIGLMIIPWIGTYVLFLLFWGPLIYFRAFYAPAIGLGLALALANYHTVSRAKPYGAAAIAVVALALFNLGFYIGPNMRAPANPRVTEARKARHWNDRTIIYYHTRTELDTAFEYFNPSADWDNLSRLSLAELEREIARAYSEGGSVWLNTSAMLLVPAEWLTRHSSGEAIEFDEPAGTRRYVRVIPNK